MKLSTIKLKVMMVKFSNILILIFLGNTAIGQSCKLNYSKLDFVSCYEFGSENFWEENDSLLNLNRGKKFSYFTLNCKEEIYINSINYNSCEIYCYKNDSITAFINKIDGVSRGIQFYEDKFSTLNIYFPESNLRYIVWKNGKIDFLHYINGKYKKEALKEIPADVANQLSKLCYIVK